MVNEREGTSFEKDAALSGDGMCEPGGNWRKGGSGGGLSKIRLAIEMCIQPSYRDIHDDD